MSKATILIVDDEMRIRRMLCDFLKGYNYEVLEACDGEQALEIFYENNNKIDLILLDIMMPKMSGTEVLSEIRSYNLVPIIMLTAKNEEYDELSGLKNGADDYVSKPFSPTILLARIENVLKRTKKDLAETIICGEIKLDTLSKEAFFKNKSVNLTPKEFDLLLYLIQNKNLVLQRQSILDAVWNYNYDGDERTVDTHIKQLRSKVGKKHIQTVHGLGYKFRSE